MSNEADLFQAFAVLPNLSKDDLKKELPQRISQGLMLLDQLLPQARAGYLRRLAERAKHHKSSVTPFAALHGQALIIDTTGPVEQELRSFYHHSYYSAFYVSRYALVSIGGYDCATHRDTERVLNEEVKRLAQHKTSHAATLAAALAEWREYRNVADYIMSTSRLAALASPQLIQDIDTKLSSFFSDWGLP